MEALLSPAFDNLSQYYDSGKVRKGLRQIEHILAQICLARPPSRKGTDREDQQQQQQQPPQRTLSELSEDPAFVAFFKLQDSFKWNVVTRLLNTLDKLLSMVDYSENDMLIVKALELMQGLLLLHPPSKILFMRDPSMNLLLDLLDDRDVPAIPNAAILTLVTALIDTPQNTRTFERLDGLLQVTSLFKSLKSKTPLQSPLKMKLMEFFYFYLMPETASIPRADRRGSVPALLQRSPSKLARAFHGGDASAASAAARRRAETNPEGDDADTLSTEEKQALLGRYLSNVHELVHDLQEYIPFGGAVC